MKVQREANRAWGFYSKRIWGNVSFFYEYGLGFSFVPDLGCLQVEINFIFIRTLWWFDPTK